MPTESSRTAGSTSSKETSIARAACRLLSRSCSCMGAATFTVSLLAPRLFLPTDTVVKPGLGYRGKASMGERLEAVWRVEEGRAEDPGRAKPVGALQGPHSPSDSSKVKSLPRDISNTTPALRDHADAEAALDASAGGVGPRHTARRRNYVERGWWLAGSAVPTRRKKVPHTCRAQPPWLIGKCPEVTSAAVSNQSPRSGEKSSGVLRGKWPSQRILARDAVLGTMPSESLHPLCCDQRQTRIP
ncbi:hypothetical protein SCP_0510810 [Sparassis crispa]|uniref:Uncharacterized protein n=1 Tax=Sparassis crispa TaxID=139825 RepID=A0A401GP53_9APHY|nr:hypothetical protein SCP_0510810 [Sparassis crispa]GBE84021.1 hypothetical protein SCP_0510810 [Sparassis crispa]